MIPDLALIADTTCGLGHVTRLTALQEEWERRGGRTFFHDFHFPLPPAVVVFDSYNCSPELMAARTRGYFVVLVNDMPEVAARCDLIVNQNLGARPQMYWLDQPVLCGPDYFLLRDDFIFHVHPHRGLFDCDSVKRKLTPGVFAAALARAEVVVCSAGCTAYEALYYNKPTFLRLSAPNQKLTYDNLISQGYAYHENELLQTLMLKSRLFRKIHQKKLRSLPRLVDGHGPRRVVDAILSSWAGRY